MVCKTAKTEWGDDPPKNHFILISGHPSRNKSVPTSRTTKWAKLERAHMAVSVLSLVSEPTFRVQ